MSERFSRESHDEFENVMPRIEQLTTLARRAEATAYTHGRPTDDQIDALYTAFGEAYINGFGGRMRALGYRYDPHADQMSEQPEFLDSDYVNVETIGINDLGVATINLESTDDEGYGTYWEIPPGMILEAEFCRSTDIKGSMMDYINTMQEFFYSREFQSESHPDVQRLMLTNHLELLSRQIINELGGVEVELDCDYYYQTVDDEPINWEVDFVDQTTEPQGQRRLLNGEIQGVVLPELFSELDQPAALDYTAIDQMPLLVLYSKYDSTLSFIPLDAVARYHLALTDE